MQRLMAAILGFGLQVVHLKTIACQFYFMNASIGTKFISPCFLIPPPRPLASTEQASSKKKVRSK